MKRRLWLWISAVVVVAVAATVTVTWMNSQDNGKTTITAMFPDASPLVPGNMVKMDGVQVGLISSIGLRDGLADVQMSVDKAILPLHTDAVATIRPVSLLGERYIDISRGSPDKPTLANPIVMRPSETATSTDLDQLLDSLNDPTSAALAALVTTLGEGVDGQGQNIDAAIKALAPAFTNTSQLGAILNQQNGVLTQLLDRATPVAQALAGANGQDLDKLVSAARQSLSSISAQQQALGSALDQLPATLQQAQTTLGRLAGVANTATPALRAARPLTDNLPQITAELNSFADSANPALASLPPVLSS